MHDELDLPIILGRPFLATGSALIDMNKRKLTFKVGSETQEFNVFSNLQIPFLDGIDDDTKMVESCCMLSTNAKPQSLGIKEEKWEPSEKTMERPKEQNQESTPCVKEDNNMEMSLGLNVKIKQECDVFVSKGEFFKGNKFSIFHSKIMFFGTQKFKCVVRF